MVLPDVNVLVYAFRSDMPRHEEYLQWLGAVVNGREPYGMADLVLAAFVRVVTNPRVFRDPDDLETALTFAVELRERSNCVPVAPTARHWQLFSDLCQRSDATGNLISDAYFAALAIEHGCEWVTTDRDFARFPDLRWCHPLDEKQ